MNPLETLVRDNLAGWGFVLIPFIAGLIVSFWAEVFNKVTPAKYHVSIFLLLLSVVACVLLVFVFPSYYERFDAFTILMLLLNIAVSFLFYPIVGKKLVGKIFDKFSQKSDEILNKV